MGLDIIARIKRRREASKIRREFKSEGIDVRHMNNKELIAARDQLLELQQKVTETARVPDQTQYQAMPNKYQPLPSAPARVPLQPVQHSEYGAPPRKGQHSADNGPAPTAHYGVPQRVHTYGDVPRRTDANPMEGTHAYGPANPEVPTIHYGVAPRKKAPSGDIPRMASDAPAQSVRLPSPPPPFANPMDVAIQAGTHAYGPANPEVPTPQYGVAPRKKAPQRVQFPPPPPPITDTSIFQQRKLDRDPQTLPPPPVERREPVTNAYGKAPPTAARKKREHYTLPTPQQMQQQKRTHSRQKTDGDTPPPIPPRRKP